MSEVVSIRVRRPLSKFEVCDSLFITIFGRSAKYTKQSLRRSYSGDGAFDRINMDLSYFRAIRWPQ